jgi:hypothetical protein
MTDDIVIDGYIFFASFHESTQKLDDTQYGILMRAVNNYAFYGIEPENLDWVIEMAFGLIKPQIDANNRKRTTYLKSVENGKKGGAPLGNKNAAKTTYETTHPCLEKQPPETTIINNGNENNKENGNGNSEKPQPLLINKIREEARKLDIILGTDLAAKAAATGIESAWLDGAFNFPAFVLERLRENPEYRRKPRHEMALLFAAAFTWENLRQEYPLWKQGKEHELEEREKMKIIEEALETARQNHPQKCGECGKELVEYHGQYWCKFCNTYYSLDEKTLKWERGK